MSRVIAVSGMDGTGKTTISMGLMRKFAKFGVPTMYVHGFSNPILSKIPALSILFKTDHKKTLSRQSSYKVKKGIPYNVTLCLWHFIVFIELALYVTYIRKKNRKHIIIFDRFWYDRYAYVLARSDDFILLRLIYTKLFQIITPDISVFLRVDCKTAKERKKSDHDYSLVFYETLSNSYEFVYNKISKKRICIRINTEKAGSDFITNAIMKNFFCVHQSILYQMFTIARKNRLEYSLLRFLSSIGFESPHVVKLRGRCEKKKQKIEKALHYLSCFNGMGFDSLLFKSYNVCTTTLPNDVDILLQSNSKNLLLKLREMAKNTRISVRSPWELEIFIQTENENT